MFRTAANWFSIFSCSWSRVIPLLSDSLWLWLLHLRIVLVHYAHLCVVCLLLFHIVWSIAYWVRGLWKMVLKIVYFRLLVNDIVHHRALVLLRIQSNGRMSLRSDSSSSSIRKINVNRRHVVFCEVLDCQCWVGNRHLRWHLNNLHILITHVCDVLSKVGGVALIKWVDRHYLLNFRNYSFCWLLDFHAFSWVLSWVVVVFYLQLQRAIAWLWLLIISLDTAPVLLRSLALLKGWVQTSCLRLDLQSWLSSFLWVLILSL